MLLQIRLSVIRVIYHESVRATRHCMDHGSGPLVDKNRKYICNGYFISLS